MAIEIKKVKDLTKRVCQPHYIFKYKYMIGDADGHTSEKVKVSLDNPYLERYIKLLGSLRPLKGHWGIVLSEDRIGKHYREKQISKEDYQFLLRMMFEEAESEFVVEPENEKYANEFWEGVCSDTEYSFLVFQGIDLKYVDEFGVKHETVIK